jgi:hypothetical protein
MQYTWLPFQSPEIRDIYAHLTPTEKQQLMAQARGYGRESGRRIGAWNGIACGLFAALYSFWRPFSLLWLVPFILVVNFMPYCFKAERQRSRARHQRVRELLAATEYAREHGYKPETLRMFAMPWSR